MIDVFMTIFLIPFFAFKYTFPIVCWFYAINFLITSDTWFEMSRKIKDKWQ
jgi:hypothetical protein